MTTQKSAKVFVLWLFFYAGLVVFLYGVFCVLSTDASLFQKKMSHEKNSIGLLAVIGGGISIWSWVELKFNKSSGAQEFTSTHQEQNRE